MKSLFTEWFWSERSANAAAKRLERKGYSTNVSYTMRADGSQHWLVEAF